MSHDAEAEESLLRGEAARRERRLADAAAAFSEAVEAFRSSGDRERLAHAISRQAQIARDAQDMVLALRFQQEALTLARDFAGQAVLAHYLRHLADILQQMGQPAAAAPLYREMMELYDGAPDSPSLEIANAARSIASNTEALGDRAAALTLWREVKSRYEALDDLFRDAYGLDENPGVAEADRRIAGLS